MIQFIDILQYAIPFAGLTCLFWCGFFTGRSKPKAHFLKDKSFEWFDVSTEKFPEEETPILVFAEKGWPQFMFSVERTTKITYTKSGIPTYLGEPITHWAYIPYPTDKKKGAKCFPFC